jgi:surfeit locus 1 family protein
MRRWMFLITFGLAGAGVLIGLGVWQLQRLAWKQSVLSDIESRIMAAPVNVPTDPTPEVDRYLPVRAVGDVLPGEIHVLVSLKHVGPGYRVIVPFALMDGRRILLDLGFVATDAITSARAIGPLSVTGNLQWPQEVDGYTPKPDLQTNTWFARDVPSMAQTLDTLPVLLIVRTSSETNPDLTPLPVTSTGIPNDHLQYAITWFSLAAIWLVMTGFFMRASRAKTES